jgi:histidyl-tRNA synthetase
MNNQRIEPRTLKGFRDFGLQEQMARQKLFAKIQNVFEQFGFLPLSTPALEYKEILMGKIGEDEKLIYSFRDNGDRDVALRYDLTVPSNSCFAPITSANSVGTARAASIRQIPNTKIKRQRLAILTAPGI